MHVTLKQNKLKKQTLLSIWTMIDKFANANNSNKSKQEYETFLFLNLTRQQNNNTCSMLLTNGIKC